MTALPGFPRASSAPADELVTVVIANYNRRDDLRQALLSVRRQDYPAVEVIVVDNASKDGSVEMLVAEFPEARVIALTENLAMEGYSVGFREARGRYVFQMDNDSEMPESTVLSAVVRRFREGPPNLAVVATRVVDTGPVWPEIHELRRSDPRTGPINLQHYHSGGVGFLRSALDQVGYYNRDVFLYGAETFLEIKFLAAGFAVLTYPEIVIVHKGSQTARSGLFFYYTLRNGLWYLRCHANGWQKARYIPTSLVYNLGQGLWKRDVRAYLRGVRDGLGPLPESLRSPVRSDRPDYVARVDAIGRVFSFRSLFRAIAARLARRNN
jgi:GT2 family glycosyltransferase